MQSSTEALTAATIILIILGKIKPTCYLINRSKVSKTCSFVPIGTGVVSNQLGEDTGAYYADFTGVEGRSDVFETWF